MTIQSVPRSNGDTTPIAPLDTGGELQPFLIFMIPHLVSDV